MPTFRLIVLSVAFLAGGVSLALAQADEATANRLLLEAVTGSGEASDPLYRRRILSALVEEFPETAAARSVTSGAVSFAGLPEAPEWHQLLVPGGEITGFDHGQFPSLGDATHPGFDVGLPGPADCGLEVTAPLAGRVVRVIAADVPDSELALIGIDRARNDRDLDRNTGNAVILRHGDETSATYSIYLHLEETPSGSDDVPWRVGMTLPAGARIGKIGETGAAKGCHLHFEARNFEGTYKYLHPEFGNIYPPGDISGTDAFRDDWIDPEAFLRRAFLARHLGSDSSAGGSTADLPQAAAPAPPAETAAQTPANDATREGAGDPEPMAGDWIDTREARRTVRAGETAGDISVAEDGSARYRGEALFAASPDPASTEVRLFLSPDSRNALAMQWDLDRGGLRAALINLGTRQVIKGDLVPETAVRGKADPGAVRQPMVPVAWSPEADYAAIPLSPAEWRADLLLIDVTTGSHAVLETDDLQPGQWTFPKLETLRWDGDDWASIDYDVLACADAACTAPAVVGSMSGGHRVSALLASAQETAADASVDAGDWGPGLVSGVDVGYFPCRPPANETDACLRALGLSEEAISFAFESDGDYSGSTVGTEFRELGPVDLATRQFIGNTVYYSPILLNGPVGFQEVPFTRDLRETFWDDASQQMLGRFPRASNIGGIEVRSHRRLPDGTQRFAVIETVNDGCRACDILGSAVSFLEIGPATGNRVVRRPVGLLLGDPGDSVDMTAEVIRSRPASLQVSLNALGYDAAPMDGYPGPQTRRALMEFQVEHCLPPTGQPDAATANALLRADRFEAPCAGARLPDGLDANTPLLSGVYVDDPVLCSATDVPYETVHLQQRIVRGSFITWGIEGGCETRRTDIRDGVTQFRGTCSEGNRSEESLWRFDVQSNESFVDLDMFTAVPRDAAPRRFTKCPDESPLGKAYGSRSGDPSPASASAASADARTEPAGQVAAGLVGAYQSPEFLPGAPLGASGLPRCVEDGDLVPLIIESTRVLGYESSCRFGAPLEPGQRAYDGTVLCKGEGETWEEPLMLSIANDTLTRQSRGRESTLLRCEMDDPSRGSAAAAMDLSGDVASDVKSVTFDRTMTLGWAGAPQGIVGTLEIAGSLDESGLRLTVLRVNGRHNPTARANPVDRGAEIDFFINAAPRRNCEGCRPTDGSFRSAANIRLRNDVLSGPYGETTAFVPRSVLDRNDLVSVGLVGTDNRLYLSDLTIDLARDLTGAMTAEAPDAELPGSHANSTAAAATPSDTLSRVEPVDLPDFREIVDGLDGVGAADKAAMTELVQTAFTLIGGMEPDGTAARLGISATDFAAEFVRNPEGMLAVVASDIVVGVGEAAFAEAAGDLVAGYMFASGPLSELPDEWQVPLRAFVDATIVESVGLLKTGSDPTGASFVGPIVDRLYDVQEIYQATNALSRTQASGLFAVANGAELTEELVRRYPGERSEALKVDWFSTTRENLREIVGVDDAGAAYNVTVLGYRALEALGRGNAEAARTEIERMRAVGNAAQGLTPLSAEGPIDLLVRLASGGNDAPKVLVETFLTSTALRSLNTASGAAPAAEVAAAPEGWRGGSPVSAALREIVLTYPARELGGCTQAHGPITPDFRRRLFDDASMTVLDQQGRTVIRPVTRQMVEGDRFCLNPNNAQCAASNYQLYYCASGEMLFVNPGGAFSGTFRVTDVVERPQNPVVSGVVTGEIYGRNLPDILSEGTACALSNGWSEATGFRWNGSCTDGRASGPGAIEWMRGPEVIWRTRVGPQWGIVLSDGVLRYDIDLNAFDFSLASCDQSLSGYRAVDVQAPADLPRAYFENSWVVQEIMRRGALLADAECPVDRKGYSNIVVSIALNGEQVVRGRNYDEGDLTWREFSNPVERAMQNELQQAERDRVAGERQRQAQARADALKAEFQRRRDAIVAQAETFLGTGRGSLDDLAAALEIDHIATLDRLERGATLRLGPVEGLATVTHDGARHYRVDHATSSPFARLEREFRSQQDFSWENWMALTQSPMPERTEIGCLFDRVSRVPQDVRDVEVELLAFSRGSSSTVMSFLCR
jgi:murein DD-endopeptidase MepM/ murein hydrolase activator NlpD